MTSCDERGPELVDLVFGEIDPAAAVALEAHLATCATCRAEEQRLLELRDELREELPGPDEALRARIRAALPAAGHRGFRRLLGRPVPAYAAAAACVAVAALTFVAFRVGPARSPGSARPRVTAPDTAIRRLAPFMSAGPYETGVAWALAPSAHDSLPGRREHDRDSL